MSNIDAQTQAHVERLAGFLDRIAAEQQDLKDFKAELKNDGWNLKMLAQLVKEKRKGADYCVAQLTLELEVQEGRKAAGLPATLEEAQKRAAAEAKTSPDDKQAKKSSGAPRSGRDKFN